MKSLIFNVFDVFQSIVLNTPFSAQMVLCLAGRGSPVCVLSPFKSTLPSLFLWFLVCTEIMLDDPIDFLLWSWSHFTREYKRISLYRRLHLSQQDIPLIVLYVLPVGQ